ncbi:MAG: alkaline phosphatase D family protein [Burkholderiales bacterium]|nr:alkaline phosphatase D family protein [Burkholderiales bacterium]MDR4516556.1 alkaline phosphatase D family protein [Nitrosomonas sp.]
MNLQKTGKLIFASGFFVSAIFLSGNSIATAGTVYSQAGDVTSDSVVLWGRCNAEQDALLTFSLTTHKNLITDKNINIVRKKSHHVSDKSDYTGSLVFKGLKPGKQYYYQATCKPLAQHTKATVKGKDKGKVKGTLSTFKTASEPAKAESIRFVWVADLGGQGWGRNPDLSITHVDGELIKGGYVVFDSMSKLNPDFALFQGDMIYADGAIPVSKDIPADVGDGTWVNNPAKDFVAITLDDFRANWKYNLGDAKMAHFLARTPVYVQWDDHEVSNNWYPGEIMPAGAPYFGISADVLAANAKQALFEYNPIDGTKLYRSVQHGKHMELFLLDERSFRDPNPDNYDPDGIEMLGQEQLAWLKDALVKSKATWKIISTHDPLSIVTGGVDDRDAWSQDDPAVLGREVQLAEILKFIKDHDIKNVVYLTSDVHFTAAISYDPSLATFQEFNPFWEFVIGPIHAGAFGSGNLDASFGPQYEYVRAPSTEGIGQNSPPPHLQSFGLVEISIDGEMTVKLIDITGAVLFEKTMLPL